MSYRPDETQTHVVAWDKNGPIEVEIIGAQPPRGSTLIEEFAHEAPPKPVTRQISSIYTQFAHDALT